MRQVGVGELRNSLRAMGQRFTNSSLERMLQKLGMDDECEVGESEWMTICRDLHRVMSFDIPPGQELLGMEFAHQVALF